MNYLRVLEKYICILDFFLDLNFERKKMVSLPLGQDPPSKLKHTKALFYTNVDDTTYQIPSTKAFQCVFWASPFQSCFQEERRYQSWQDMIQKKLFECYNFRKPKARVVKAITKLRISRIIPIHKLFCSRIRFLLVLNKPIFIIISIKLFLNDLFI